MEKDPFKEYIRISELGKEEKARVWSTAIGLQAVDGLKPSQYLLEAAIRNVEGDITLEEVQELVHSYYEENPKNEQEHRTEEADKVSIRIVEILSQTAFSFTITEYISIHKQLFEGIYSHAGNLRDYNITKKEWVLDGDTVVYGSATQLYETLEYDLLAERRFTYKGLDIADTIHHLTLFISNLWQIHIFEEGNTRTTAVFLIKYLRMLGFDVTNQIFAEHAWYFRNSLVRANYRNLKAHIHESTAYLERFLRNLLLGEENTLRNRELHVKYNQMYREDEKPYIEDEKPYIEDEKPYFKEEKPYFGRALVSQITEKQIQKLSYALGKDTVFGRRDVMSILNLQKSRSSELLKRMLALEVITPVEGYGKGKYRFIKFI